MGSDYYSEDEYLLIKDLVLCGLIAFPFLLGFLINCWVFLPAATVSIAIGCYFYRKKWI